VFDIEDMLDALAPSPGPVAFEFDIVGGLFGAIEKLEGYAPEATVGSGERECAVDVANEAYRGVGYDLVGFVRNSSVYCRYNVQDAVIGMGSSG